MMHLYFFKKKTLYLEVCKFEQNYFRLEIFFGEYHRLEYRDR